MVVRPQTCEQISAPHIGERRLKPKVGRSRDRSACPGRIRRIDPAILILSPCPKCAVRRERQSLTQINWRTTALVEWEKREQPLRERVAPVDAVANWRLAGPGDTALSGWD